MNAKSKNLKSIDEFIEEQYGQKGTAKREKFEEGYKEFLVGHMIQQARLERGLTQQQLADKVGTNKGYISKVENNIKDVRISTLQRIIEIGLGGHLKLSISLDPTTAITA